MRRLRRLTPKAFDGLSTGSGFVTLGVAGNVAVDAPLLTGTGTVDLRISGTLSSGSSASPIQAAALAIEGGATAVGSATNPVYAAVSLLAATVGGGGVFLINSVTLTIGTVLSISGVTASAGGITITSRAAVVVTAPGINITSGPVTLTGNGSIVIAGAVHGTTPTIVGGSGSSVNALLVDFANGASLPDGLTFHGNAAGNDSMTISDSGASLGHTYTLTAASAARDATSIGFSNLASVSVKAGNQPDSFNVTASPTTAYFLDGGSPPNTPGDALNLDAGGAAVTGGAGSYTVQGDKPVTITNIETVHMNNAAAIGGFAGPDTADRNQLAGLIPTQRFVQVLYLDALGRSGSMAELNSWVSVYNSSGANARNAVITSIERSSEARDHLVKSWYKAFLGRSAAAGEEMGWVNMLLGGATEETVLANILGTQEFFNRARTLVDSGSANERYVQALYQLLLGRSGSASEVAGQAALIATVGRAGMAQGVLSSGEYRSNLTNAYYEILLHRVPSAAEVAGWLNLNLDQNTQRIDTETSIEFFNNG
jgi:hypothetical protein